MPSIKPLSLVFTEETDLSAETEDFDHMHEHAHVDVHQRYHISTPLLEKAC